MGKNIIFLCDSSHGIYLPSFLCSHSENIWNIPSDQWNYMANPENIEKDDYLDLWESILNNAEYVDNNGKIWTLHHDGDLFSVALDSMTEQEKIDFFGDY